jgi:hypothetical protein
MVKALENELLCHATDELIEEHGGLKDAPGLK